MLQKTTDLFKTIQNTTSTETAVIASGTLLDLMLKGIFSGTTQGLGLALANNFKLFCITKLDDKLIYPKVTERFDAESKVAKYSSVTCITLMDTLANLALYLWTGKGKHTLFDCFSNLAKVCVIEFLGGDQTELLVPQETELSN